LRTIFGNHGKQLINLKTRNTESALSKVLSQASNIPVIFDEYHNKFEYTTTLQASFDNSGYLKSSEKSSRGTTNIDVRSSLMLTSNELPDDDVFFTRCIYLPIPKEEWTKEQREAYLKLKDLEELGAGCVAIELMKHRDLIKSEFTKTNKIVFDSIKKELSNQGQNGIVERAIENLATIITIPLILHQSEKIIISEFTDYEDVLNEFVEIACQQIISQHTVASERGDLMKFMAKLQSCFDNYKIHDGTHFFFKMGSDDTVSIVLHFPKIYSAYLESYKGVGYETPLDRDAVKSALINFAGVDNWKDLTRSAKFKEKITDKVKSQKPESNSCELDYERLSEIYGIDFKNRTNPYQRRSE
jgi:hypothetical protein